MVLKRLIVTALGALGLGALATGPASAQQVPAPDFFNNQVACSSANAMASVPDPLAGTGANMMGPSLLDQALRGATGMGDPIATTAADTAAAASLNYVIDATVANCGEGSTASAFLAGNANLDLATGYTEVLTQFQAVVREEGDVKTAQRNLNNSLRNNPDGNHDALRTALTDAQAALATEVAKLNALGAGPIYQAGIREWRAKGAVDEAIIKWNNAVPAVAARLNGGTIGTDTVSGLRQASYANYVALPGQSLLNALTDTDGNLVRGTALTAYLDDGAGGDGATDGFDADGNLILPMTGTGNDAVVTEAPLGVGAIMDNSMSADNAVAALEKAIADTSDTVQARRLGEALRRAKLEQAHLNEYLRRALNDNTEQDTSADPTADDYVLDSIRTRNAAYQKALSDRTAAEADLRSAVVARHEATQAVQMAFQGPGSYFDQYVARHMYHVSKAQKAVADAEADGQTPSKTLTDAVTDTQKALDTATMARDRYQSMVADADNPAVALINALLAPDSTDTVNNKDDDDGQAVVDAVSGTYNVAKDARDTANRVADEVSGLTGEGGDVAMNTAAIAENAGDIEKLDGRVAMNEGEIWDADGNSRIDANETRSMENRTMIGTNATNIQTNATNIMNNTTMIGENRGMIDTNATGIMTNAGNIMTNSGRLDAHEMAIAEGARLIGENTAAIGANRSSIMQNADMIGGLQDQMETVRAGVAASMALAGMPAINGRGISIGVGSYDGESAFAVGFQIQSEMASFKVGVTSAGGETGASAGVGFQF